jgi:glycine/D-amino acid oxidase-like deaminating enzyme/nitrite reductase/ring-hydroxylating ferredoxin subunit
MPNVTSGTRTPIWFKGAPPISQRPLESDMTVDVCVIGAGIAGLTTAYYLVHEGKSVAVLEDGRIGSGETGRTSAHLASALDDRFFWLEHMHGADGARLAAESHAFAIDEIERISRENGIRCSFRRVAGYLFRDSDKSVDQLAKEFNAARRAGLEVSWADRAPLTNFDSKRCLVFANQAQFHPMLYLTGLAAAITNAGGEIFTGTHAQTVTGGSPAGVRTSAGFTVSAGAIVVATNVPINEKIPVHTKQAAYRTYMIGAKIGKGIVPHALFWDTGDPYHYVRVTDNPDDVDTEILLVGGEDEKTGQAEKGGRPFKKLEAWTRQRFSSIGEIVGRWSGQIIEPVDGLAHIGRDPSGAQNVYIATGDSGNGLTHGGIAGRLISDLILGHENPWARLYDPSRKAVRSIAHFLDENVNALAQYTEYVTGSDIDQIAEIPPDEGAVVRRGLKKLAVYRDAQGQVHERSAVCPHLGAIVQWNDQEKTWDCPAHGSRFTCDGGTVLNGPANSPLDPVAEETKTER